MYVFKKVNRFIHRDFKCKLSSWTRGGVAKQGTWMVCLYYVLYRFPSRDPANSQIKYRINWSCFPFYVQPISKWHFTHKEYSKQYPETYLDEIQEWIEYLSTKYVLCRFDNHSIFIDVFKIRASPGESRYSTVACRLGHLLLVRTSVTINEVYSLKCLLEFVSFITFAP